MDARRSKQRTLKDQYRISEGWAKEERRITESKIDEKIDIKYGRVQVR